MAPVAKRAAWGDRPTNSGVLVADEGEEHLHCFVRVVTRMSGSVVTGATFATCRSSLGSKVEVAIPRTMTDVGATRLASVVPLAVASPGDRGTRVRFAGEGEGRAHVRTCVGSLPQGRLSEGLTASFAFVPVRVTLEMPAIIGTVNN